MKRIIKLQDFNICLKITDDKINSIMFTDEEYEGNEEKMNGEEAKVYEQCVQELREYLSGERQYFDLSYTETGSKFELRVWNEIRKVPYGKTISYSELASRCGIPEAVRSVASACGRNKLMLITPCHRIILKSGKTGQFAGDENTKKWLLETERRNISG